MKNTKPNRDITAEAIRIANTDKYIVFPTEGKSDITAEILKEYIDKFIKAFCTDQAMFGTDAYLDHGLKAKYIRNWAESMLSAALTKQKEEIVKQVKDDLEDLLRESPYGWITGTMLNEYFNKLDKLLK